MPRAGVVSGRVRSRRAQQPSLEPSSRLLTLLFGALVFLFCAWVLSLPLFPTQDGPIHKYYVHVIASLLSGANTYDAYLIRHPLPPYAIHYGILLELTRWVPMDLAEKLFVCMIFVCIAYSFRYCARALGPSGDLVSVCMVPLLLNWSVMMGFLNYSLAVGFFFLAVGLWCRASEGRGTLWFAFTLTVLVLTMTHPVPLLLLIAFCALDLLIRMVQDFALARRGRHSFSLGRYGWQLVGFTIACLSFLYPLASADKSRSVSNLHSTALHKDALISTLALFGISPFDTRSTNPLIDLYRLGLYALLVGAIAVAAAGLRGRWRFRRLRAGDALLFGTIAVLIAIPVLPPSMNGSNYFSQRLMIFVWLGALAAASGYDRTRSRLRLIAPCFAIAMTALVLLPADIFIRPVAKQLVALERQPLPSKREGLSLLDPAMLKSTRVQHQLGFNPYVWSGALPLIRSDDVMLNSPWLDLTIMPLRPAPQGDLMVNAVPSPEQADKLINGNIDLPALSPALRAQALRTSQFILLVATPPALAAGLPALIGSAASTAYHCADHSFYMVCTAATAATAQSGPGDTQSEPGDSQSTE